MAGGNRHRRRSDDEEEDERRRRKRREREREKERSESEERRKKKRKKRKSQSDEEEEGEADDRRRDRKRDDDKKRKKSKKEKKKKSKKKKRSSSSSSSGSDGGESDESGADSDSSTELLLRLEREKDELRRRRQQEKDALKAAETLEEKRQRRLLKKELKAMRQKEKIGWDDEYAHYTNDDNPFGDANLTQTFRWQKKLQKEGLDELDERQLSRMQRQKQEEQRQELEKVKLRRLQREKEREERQEMVELEERSRENEKFNQWQQKEDDFHLQQARLRSKIRIQDGRAKPIDLLAKYVSAEEDLDAVEMHEPYTYLNGLTVGDLEDLLADIKVYGEIDLQKNRDFWEDIVVIVNDELSKLRKMDKLQQQSVYEAAAERRQGINQAVAEDVQKVFEGKTSTQLAQLQANIEKKLSQRTDGVDVNYWESLLSQLKAHLARARLRDKHKDNLKQKLEMLKAQQQQQLSSSAATPSTSKAPAEPEPTPTPTPSTSSTQPPSPEPGPSTEFAAPQPGPLHKPASSASKKDVDPCVHQYNLGQYSPVYLSADDLEPGTIVVTEDEDSARREMDQRRALHGGQVDDVVKAEEKALEREAKKGMTDEEASFAVESVLEQTYEWSDKYRPRKPRYFNRVHTGFEWNKYNQTHYDVDNPPPKIVQGYKFNIFYPDLINKSLTPSYTLTPCSDNRDFCTLRITAGPPYEDIAFKIVNREWEFGYKRGFKCQFLNNIFQLWFHFKRLRYRR